MAQNAAMMIGTTGRVRLPIAFDARALLDDAQALPPEAWEPHFNRALYRNDWSGVALRSNGGAGLYPNPHAGQAFVDTRWLERCPAVRMALARFACRTTAVRFLRVGSDSEIFEHRDYDLTADGGEARLHVCVQTSDAVTFFLDGAPVVMEPGSCWYLDVSRPHRVINAGATARVHLVVDCVLDDWLREAIARGAAGNG
ncbi:MAG TPA: aspartyl/asparaginyl beta-hydroxylase domain-containing protein [Candidatus Acidoferrales bacterium]|nr:aspartyl/asparaginyl beta-hydroxylase domain-containing protein [Candidatus Acidoferrales bacterium]